MRDLIRDSFGGQLIRFLTRNRIGRYIEELESFELPAAYSSERTIVQNDSLDPQEVPKNDSSKEDLSQSEDGNLSASEKDIEAHSVGSGNRDEITEENAIEPRRTNNGITLVTWYTNDDPENPQNWSTLKKAWVGGVIFFYTFAVYIGSSLYAAGEADIVRTFGVSEVTATLGLALYVVGYGLGPLLFSPLSEIPAIGRNPPYALTFVVFVILCVPTSLVNNFAGLMVLRFLLGFFGSPCLATGPASYGDFLHPSKMVYALTFWGGGATLGPVSANSILISH
jgi:DHA1 family multidrug resistance protein-like MFS transporter